MPPNGAGFRGNGDQFSVGIAWIKRFGTYVGGGQCARFMAALMTGFARAATQQLWAAQRRPVPWIDVRMGAAPSKREWQLDRMADPS